MLPKPVLVDVTDPGLRPLIAGFLHGSWAAEHLEEWLPRRAELPAGVTLVGPRGQVLDRNALRHFAVDSRTHGVIERQRRAREDDRHGQPSLCLLLNLGG